jgi:hypothetical protein
VGGSEEVLFMVKSWTPEPRGAGFGVASHDLWDDVASLGIAPGTCDYLRYLQDLEFYILRLLTTAHY